MCVLLQGEGVEKNQRDDARSKFLLTSSIYRRCCVAPCDDFLQLFVNDQLAQEVFTHLQQANLSSDCLANQPAEQPAEQSIIVTESVTTPEEKEEEKTAKGPLCGCRLSNLLIAVLMANTHTDLQIEVATLLLSALQAAESVDAVFQSVPTIRSLFTRVLEDHQQGLFMTKQFGMDFD